MSHRDVGGSNYELLQVREIDGAPRVDCPKQNTQVLFSECQACEHGTVVRLKGAGLPYLICPSENVERKGMQVWPRDAVRSIMTRVVTVRQGLSIEKLVRTFLDEDISAAPVVDEAGAVIGMVSKSDVVFDEIGWKELRDAALSLWPENAERYADMVSEDDLYLHELLRERTVGDVMTRAPVWVAPGVTISAAAEVMAKSGLHHLPVLDEHDRPIGMLGDHELAQWLADQR